MLQICVSVLVNVPLWSGWLRDERAVVPKARANSLTHFYMLSAGEGAGGQAGSVTGKGRLRHIDVQGPG